MKLLEIRNNLIKLSFTEQETPILGRFIAITSGGKSYVGQFVNIKSDISNGLAVARLLFTFTSDGIVDSYDGSVPSINSQVTNLPSEELLNLITVENPIKLGHLAQQDMMFSIDASVFENNFTVLSEHDFEKANFISNCVRQLFQMKEKSVIIDTDGISEDFKKIKLAIDFKLPLNADMIDYIFEYDLKDVDAGTKAVIQDIFKAVQDYLQTLNDDFLPIDDFINVVTAQYKESQMPELALLKNKLLKYRDANIFANSKDELLILEQKLLERNSCFIDLKNINDELQNRVILYIHSELEKINKYIYLFVSLTDDNSNKRLLKKLINHNHIFTTIFASHSYKYAAELKRHAENILLFAPISMQNDFAQYSTFLNKLNRNEAIIYGKLTQNIPLIIDIENLDLDLTKDDVFGDREKFFPASDPINNEKWIRPQEFIEQPVEEKDKPAEKSNTQTSSISDKETIIQPLENIMDEDNNDNINNSEFENNNALDESNQTDEISESENTELLSDDYIEDLTEDDLDYIENQSQEDDVMSINEEDNIIEETEDRPSVVPVYPVEDNFETSLEEFSQGDKVTHPRYGNGIIEKIIKYGNKTLCSIEFENVGRRLLDPSISEFQKI